MSTSCLIGKIINDSGRCVVIYCGSDGYVEGGVGDTLKNFYKTEDKIDKLLKLGDLSLLGKEPIDEPKLWNYSDYSSWEEWAKEAEKYCRSYKSRGDINCSAKTYNSPKKAIKEVGQIFNYFFLDDVWYCYINGIHLSHLIDISTGKVIKEWEKKE